MSFYENVLKKEGINAIIDLGRILKREEEYEKKDF